MSLMTGNAHLHAGAMTRHGLSSTKRISQVGQENVWAVRINQTGFMAFCPGMVSGRTRCICPENNQALIPSNRFGRPPKIATLWRIIPQC